MKPRTSKKGPKDETLGQMLAKVNPGLPKESQVLFDEYARLFRSIKGQPSEDALERFFKGEPDRRLLEKFCHELRKMNRARELMKRRGRPRSKVSSAQFISGKLATLFAAYTFFLPSALEKVKPNKEILRLPNISLEESRYYECFLSMGGVESQEGEQVSEQWMFNLGALWAFMVAYSLVLEAVLQELPDLMRLSHSVKTAKDKVEKSAHWLRELGFSPAGVAEYEGIALSRLPNDLMRKLRKPQGMRREAGRLMDAVRTIDGIPYVSDVARRLNKSEAELMNLYKLARKCGMGIDLGKDTKGSHFVVN